MSAIDFPGVKVPPKSQAQFLRFMNPLLDALREKGGQAQSGDIYDAIAQTLNLSDEERAAALKNGTAKFKNQIAWCRFHLLQTGYIDAPAYGVWRLTDKGKDAHLDGPDIDEIFHRSQEIMVLSKAAGGAEKSAKPAPEPNSGDNADEGIAPPSQRSPYSDHRPALIKLIGQLAPNDFEKFCSALLARVGVENVQTTGAPGDGGIDGTGPLAHQRIRCRAYSLSGKEIGRLK